MNVIRIKEHKDGSATMTYEINQEEKEMFKSIARKRKKKFDDAFINRIVYRALEDGFNNAKQKNKK